MWSYGRVHYILEGQSLEKKLTYYKLSPSLEVMRCQFVSCYLLDIPSRKSKVLGNCRNSGTQKDPKIRNKMNTTCVLGHKN